MPRIAPPKQVKEVVITDQGNGTAIVKTTCGAPASVFNDEVATLSKAFAAATLRKRQAEDEAKIASLECEALSRQICELTELAGLKPPYRVDGGRVSIVRDMGVEVFDKEAFMHDLANLGKEDLITEQVHYQTLKSFIKERQKENKRYPAGVSVTPFNKAQFTKDSKKGVIDGSRFPSNSRARQGGPG